MRKRTIASEGSAGLAPSGASNQQTGAKDRMQTILLVEDDPDDVALVRRALTETGLAYDLQVVGSAEDAIAYLMGLAPYAHRQRHPLPALVLLDLRLPGKSGRDVLKFMRAYPGFERLPAILLTGSQQETDIEAAYDPTVNSVMLKPLSAEQLAAACRSLIGPDPRKDQQR